MNEAVRFTYPDLQTFPDDGQRRELISGRLYVTPAPWTLHQMVSINLAVTVGGYLRRTRLGRVWAAPFDVILSGKDVVEPDFMYLSSERLSLASERGLEGVPDWLVEIASPVTRERDHGVKRKFYEKYGVRLYWLIDPDTEEIHVWEAGEERIYSFEDTLSPSVLPGLSFTGRDLLD